MSSTVDFRRFRTWDAEPAMAGTPPWKILVRYGYVRLASSWAGRTLLILLVIAAVLSVGGISYAFASGSGVSAQGWSGAFMLYTWPLAGILLMVAAPLFADDLRFNAPLFYFSKPLRVSDYFRGKLAFLASLVGGAVVVPIVALMLLALLVGVPVGQPPMYDDSYTSAAEAAALRADWHATHIDTVPEWVAAAAVTVPGMMLAIALFASLAVVCSIHTRRGWHAGMAFVAIVGGTSIAGGVLADSFEGAAANLWSPIGWTYLLVAVPLRLMFQPVDGLRPYEAQSLEGAGIAVPIAYALVLLTTALALWLSHRRLQAQEARL